MEEREKKFDDEPNYTADNQMISSDQEQWEGKNEKKLTADINHWRRSGLHSENMFNTNGELGGYENDHDFESDSDDNDNDNSKGDFLKSKYGDLASYLAKKSVEDVFQEVYEKDQTSNIHFIYIPLNLAQLYFCFCSLIPMVVD